MRMIDADRLKKEMWEDYERNDMFYPDSHHEALRVISNIIDYMPTVSGWISVQDRLPPEKETIFAKFKGTDKWGPAMFATSSEDVRVVVRFEDGSRRVWHDNTMDGKWQCEREKCAYPKCTVTHWMPNPELPKEET